MSSLYEQEIAKHDRHLDAGVITMDEYRDRVADAKARHGIGGTTPPTNTTTATAATAAPRRTAKESLASQATAAPQPKKKCKWDAMPLPEAIDKDGDPITEGLSVITVRAVEGGKMVADPEKGKNGKKWQGSGLPGGKIAFGTGWNNEWTGTPAQFLQLYAKMDRIYAAIMGETNEHGEEVPGLLDDSQPREILVL